MKRKSLSIIIAAALTLAGCAEADAGITYVTVGGISEPTRVWSSAVTAEEASEPGEVPEPEAYIPDVLAMEPTLFVTNKPACTYTSDKDGEVVDELDEGAELTLVGTTGKGYYQTEGGSFISASDVERAVEVAMVEPQEEAEPQQSQAQPTTTTTTTQQTQPSTTEAQPNQQTAEAPIQQEEPVQEQPQQEQQPAQDDPGYDVNPVTGGAECEYTPPDAETQAWMDAHADGEVYEVGTYDDGAEIIIRD